jgi:hypothetical protein
MSELGTSASLHCAFAVPFLLILEVYVDGHLMPPGVARKTFEDAADAEGARPSSALRISRLCGVLFLRTANKTASVSEIPAYVGGFVSGS